MRGEREKWKDGVNVKRDNKEERGRGKRKQSSGGVNRDIGVKGKKKRDIVLREKKRHSCHGGVGGEEK